MDFLSRQSVNDALESKGSICEANAACVQQQRVSKDTIDEQIQKAFVKFFKKNNTFNDKQSVLKISVKTSEQEEDHIN